MIPVWVTATVRRLVGRLMSEGAAMDTDQQQGFMKLCQCGAYRLGVYGANGWVWSAGCPACNTIEGLREELERAKIEWRRACHSARAAQSAMNRMREGCHYAHMAEKITGSEWN